MAKQRYTTEEIIHKLREAEVLIGERRRLPQGLVTDEMSCGQRIVV